MWIMILDSKNRYLGSLKDMQQYFVGMTVKIL